MDTTHIPYTDIPNNENWLEEFSKRLSLKTANRVRNRIIHAMKVLEETPIGEKVCFEGSCPSGSTYDDFIVWDGTTETREHIAYRAFRHGFPNSSSAWCRRVKDVKYGIGSAMLRTGFRKI